MWGVGGFRAGFWPSLFLALLLVSVALHCPLPPCSALTCLEKFSALWALHISRTSSIPVGWRSLQLSRLFIHEQALPMAWRQKLSQI